MSAVTSDPRRRRLLQLMAVLAAAAAIVAVLIVISSSGTDDEPARQAGEAVAGQAEVAARFTGIPQDGIALGEPDAPVTLVEFADMQCPFCADFARDGLPTLVENEVRAGTLRIEFRSMAFLGEDSETLARAVAGAAAQNRLWQAVDLLFINQGRENSGFATPEFVRGTLGAIEGLDVDRALADGDGPAGKAAIDRAQQLAQSSGVDSTPAFLLGRTGGRLEKLDVSTLDGSEIREAVRGLAGT